MTDDTAPIGIACTNCGKQLKVPGELAGKRVKCPQCSQALNVPNVVGEGIDPHLTDLEFVIPPRNSAIHRNV